MGSQKSYTKVLRDGLRGAKMDTQVRRYQSKYFQLYNSYTKGGVAEGIVSDIKPIWRHWTVYGLAFCALALIYLVGSGRFKFSMPDSSNNRSTVHSQKPAVAGSGGSSLVPSASTSAPSARSSSVAASPSPSPVLPQKKSSVEGFDLFAGRLLYIFGRVVIGGTDTWYIGILRNGQRVGSVTSTQLAMLGYQFFPLNGCVGVIVRGDSQTLVTCEAPQIAVSSEGNQRRVDEGPGRVDVSRADPFPPSNSVDSVVLDSSAL